MISLGLDATQQQLFSRGLAIGHRVAFRVYILDLNQNHLEDVSDRLVDGQVNIDTSRTPVRDASLTLANRGLMSFESGSISTGANHAQRLIQIYYGVSSRLYPDWVWVPVFCGPVSTFSRDGALVNLTAVGKERLMQTMVWTARNYNKGSLKTSVLRDFLTKAGESLIDIPDGIKSKLDRSIIIPPDREVWERAQSIAGSWGQGKLMYDGRGRCRLFSWSGTNRWTFTSGQGGVITSTPKLSYSAEEGFTNAARVYGATPKNATKPVFAEYVAPATHPLSPGALKRNGQPLYYGQVVQDNAITSKADALALAKTTVENGLVQAVQVEFTCLPIPHLEEWDTVTLAVDSYAVPFRLERFSIPLNPEGEMTIGYTAKVSRWRK